MTTRGKYTRLTNIRGMINRARRRRQNQLQASDITTWQLQIQQDQQANNLKELQKRVIEKHSPGVLGQAKQNVLSLVLTQVLTAIFVVLWMLRKKGVNAIEVEIVLLPLIIDSFQIMALANIQRKSPLHHFLRVINALFMKSSIGEDIRALHHYR